jgi:hypothetical protein
MDEQAVNHARADGGFLVLVVGKALSAAEENLLEGAKQRSFDETALAIFQNPAPGTPEPGGQPRVAPGRGGPCRALRGRPDSARGALTLETCHPA